MDGLEVLTMPPTTADQVTAQGVWVWRHGYVVDAISYNAAEGKDVAPLMDAPPISLDQLTEIARSDVWFSWELAAVAIHDTSGFTARQSSRTWSSSSGVWMNGSKPYCCAGDELLAAEQLDPRVVGVVPTRRGLQLVAADLEARLLELADDPLERAGRIVSSAIASRIAASRSPDAS